MDSDQIQQPLIKPSINPYPQPQLQPQPQPDLLTPLSITKLFTFADKKDIIMMIIGSFCAMLSGAIMPLFSYLFGDIIQNLIEIDNIDRKSKALKFSMYIWILAAVAWIISLIIQLAFISIFFWSLAGQRQSIRYRKQYYKALLKKDIQWYDANNSNELSTKFSNQINAIQGGIGQKIPNSINLFLMGLLGIILGFAKGWKLALVISSLIPIIGFAGFLVMKAITVQTQSNSKTYAQAGARAQQVFKYNQCFNGIKTIKNLVGQDYEVGVYKNLIQKAKNTAIKYTIFFALSMGFVILAFMGSYSLGFYYGAQLIKDGEYNAGKVMSVFFCIIIGSSALGQASPNLKAFAQAKAEGAKVFSILQNTNKMQVPQNGIQIQKINQIKLANVNFTYPSKKDVQVLKNVNISFRKNKVTALVGYTGSGKSSIVQLIQRFYDPDSGSVQINGINLKELDLQKYRSKIGYVGQQPVLFNISIRQNLLLANPEATDQEIYKALQMANAISFINKMENKIQSVVGASGSKVSGGQKQRIAIARAILRNPQILILDQATSALDRKNQKEIQKTIQLIQKQRTTIVIAHRLSTVIGADQIIVIQNGQVVQRGNHQQLIKHEGKYYTLVKNQLKPQQQQENIQNCQKQEQTILNQKQQQKNEQQVKEEDTSGVFKRLVLLNKENIGYIIIGMVSAIGVGCYYPLFSLIFSDVLVYLNDVQHNWHTIKMYSLYLLILALVGGLVNASMHFFFGVAGEKLVYKIRSKVFENLIKQPSQFYDKQKNNSGALSAALAQDVNNIKNYTTGVVSIMIMNVATFGLGLGFAFFGNWAISLIVLGLSPLLVLGGIANMQRLKNMAAQTTEAYVDAKQQFSSTVNNIRTVYSFGNNKLFLQKFDKLLQKPLEIQQNKSCSSAFLQGYSQGSIFTVYGIAFYLAAVFISKNQGHSDFTEYTAGVFKGIFCLVFAAIGLGNNAKLMPDQAKARSSGKKLLQFYDMSNQTQDQQQIVEQPIIKGNIEFKNVYFKYPNTQKNVLNNISFKIQQGMKVAFVGPSGCGKSTLIQLIMRLYEVDQGQIIIEGRTIKQFRRYNLRKHFGVVSQQPILFKGTIQQNIKYKNNYLPLQLVKKAANIAKCTDFIQKIQLGYSSDVGNKGEQLSGGQKQRVALARCFIQNPNVLLLGKYKQQDQATSALDVDTQKRVFKQMQEQFKQQTWISVAHRISTIKQSDLILVFSQGCIVEQGKYQQLIQLKQNLYRLQRGSN